MIKEIKKTRLYSKVIEYIRDLEFIDGDNRKLFYVDGMSYVYQLNTDENRIVPNIYHLTDIFGDDITEDEFIKIIKIKHNIK